jgi:hypothetical protein
VSLPQEIDVNKVTTAIVESDIGPAAKEESARLVEGWLEGLDTFPETQWKNLFVETPFYIQLDPKFYVVGQMDAGFHDGEGVILAEWKSRRAPKLKKDGTAWAGDDEDGWLADISNGPQLGVYGLAGREGTFITPHEYRPDISEPRILVRAAVKSNPVVTWPNDYRKGLFTMPGALLDTVRAALLSEATSIRARRKLGQVPYQVPGLQCTNMYRRTCGFYEEVCRKRLTPPAEPVGWHHPDDKAPDPGLDVATILGLDIHDPQLVVLSQSALQDHYQCAERARIRYGGFFAKGGSLGEDFEFEREVGTGLHKALATIYRQRESK